MRSLPGPRPAETPVPGSPDSLAFSCNNARGAVVRSYAAAEESIALGNLEHVRFVIEFQLPLVRKNLLEFSRLASFALGYCLLNGILDPGRDFGFGDRGLRRLGHRNGGA